MTEPTQTAVIVAVDAAEDVVAVHRRRLDASAVRGVPAHVTVLYPFVAPNDVDDTVISKLRAALAPAAAFDCAFDRCAWFGENVLWLAPDRDREFRELTSRIVAAFPGYLPYDGQFDDVTPHLTVGETKRGTTDDLRAAEADIRRRLPISVRVEHALLIAGSDQPSSWHTLAELPLGTARH